MENHDFLNDFIKECSEEKPETTDEKFIGWESLVSILIYEGIKWILPEIREWVKLGATAITLKRLEVKKKLIEYAAEKELDFPAAEKAAEVISNKINEKNINKIIKSLES